ncbi:hypothetical protein RRG08_034943 [Elysia crispata]|uniref:Uncharacterized protein n=1 Tax=Elysia crispata TaxID=231223 RepID=A0AAE0Y221_9GAST|nr:hypothetical protein RRG08_034943 [Elysia crispata]
MRGGLWRAGPHRPGVTDGHDGRADQYTGQVAFLSARFMANILTRAAATHPRLSQAREKMQSQPEDDISG